MGLSQAKVQTEPRRTLLIVGTSRKDKQPFFEIAATVATDVVFLAEETAVWPFLKDLSDHIVTIKNEHTFDSIYEDVSAYLDNNKIRLHGIITYMDPWLDLVAYLCERFSIPSNQHTSLKIIQICKTKDVFRQMCNEMHVFRSIQNIMVDPISANDIDLSKVKLPCIVKPVSGSGSMFTQKLYKAEEVDKVVKSLSSKLKNYEGDINLKKSLGTKFLIEELVTGEEFDLDGYCIESEIVICYVNWNQESDEYGNEYGGLYPAKFSKEEQEKIISAISDLLKSFGKVTSFFHIEGILTDEKEVFPIECNIRQAGAEAPCIFEFMTGLHPARVTAQLALGVDVDAPSKQPQGYVRSTNERFNEEGVITDIHISPELQASNWYVGHGVYVAVGQEYYCDYTGNAGTLYWLAAHGDTPDEASHHLEELKKFITIKISPHDAVL